MNADSLNRDSEDPLYMQVASYLEDRISGGDLKPGERLPSESELTKEFNVSRVTVRQALAHLSKLGIVMRRQGIGTFARGNIRFDLGGRSQTILEALQEKGIEPEVVVLGMETVVPPERVGEALGVAPRQQVMRVRRLYKVEGEPVALVYVYVAMEMSSVAIELAQSPQQTTYSVFEDKLGMVVRWARHVIKAVGADAEVAKALDMHVGDACLSMDRISYGEDDAVIEFLTFYHPPEGFQYELKVPRRERSFVLKVYEP